MPMKVLGQQVEVKLRSNGIATVSCFIVFDLLSELLMGGIDDWLVVVDIDCYVDYCRRIDLFVDSIAITFIIHNFMTLFAVRSKPVRC
jgi:hypothetical protein